MVQSWLSVAKNGLGWSLGCHSAGYLKWSLTVGPISGRIKLCFGVWKSLSKPPVPALHRRSHRPAGARFLWWRLHRRFGLAPCAAASRYNSAGHALPRDWCGRSSPYSLNQRLSPRPSTPSRRRSPAGRCPRTSRSATVARSSGCPSTVHDHPCSRSLPPTPRPQCRRDS